MRGITAEEREMLLHLRARAIGMAPSREVVVADLAVLIRDSRVVVAPDVCAPNGHRVVLGPLGLLALRIDEAARRVVA